ncbi:hypothetical protein PUN4_1270001 [Paraburkholderia unamae]|nr:hypothetical protein PUN4_1270001 [Paraburkholderia unamae]
MCVVAVSRFLLDVRGVDGNPTFLSFRCRVDLVVRLGFTAKLLGQNRRDRCRQRGLAVVNVTDRAHVHVRLGPLKLTLGHFRLLRGFFRTLRGARKQSLACCYLLDARPLEAC